MDEMGFLWMAVFTSNMIKALSDVRGGGALAATSIGTVGMFRRARPLVHRGSTAVTISTSFLQQVLVATSHDSPGLVPCSAEEVRCSDS